MTFTMVTLLLDLPSCSSPAYKRLCSSQALLFYKQERPEAKVRQSRMWALRQDFTLATWLKSTWGWDFRQSDVSWVSKVQGLVASCQCMKPTQYCKVKQVKIKIKKKSTEKKKVQGFQQVQRIGRGIPDKWKKKEKFRNHGTETGGY